MPTFKASSLLPFEPVTAGDPAAETLDFDFDLIAEKGSRAEAGGVLRRSTQRRSL